MSIADAVQAIGQLRAMPRAVGLPAPEQVDEVMDELEELDLPELRDLLRWQDKTVGGLRPEVIGRLRGHLAAGEIKLDDAYDFLDELREHGRQHLFLFQIQHSHRDDLARLHAQWDEAIPPVANAHRQAKVSLADKPAAPVLTGIFETDHHLVFRWIETRAWEQAVPGQTERKPRTERSVNFFRIDLRTGDAEIRIQKLRPHCEVPLLEELRIYRELVQQFVDLEHFSPFLLEPAMRRLLTARRMSVQRWRIDWPESEGRLGGSVDPGFVQSLLFRLANYFALEVAGEWLFRRTRGSPRRVRASLDGKNNEVQIPNRCIAEEEEVILHDIRGGRRRELKIRELHEVARDHEELLPALERFDQELTLGAHEIELAEMGKEWVVGTKSAQAAQELAARHPERFRLRHRVRCPDHRRPVEENGKVRWWDHLGEIPAEVPCAHGRRRRVMHPTANQIETVLLFEPPPTHPPLVPRLTRIARKWIPQEMESTFGKIVVMFFLAFVYIPLVIATALGFLKLLERFPGAPALLVIGLSFLVALVFETGICIHILGEPIADGAANLLIKIASLLKPMAGAKESEASPHVNRVDPAQTPPRPVVVNAAPPPPPPPPAPPTTAPAPAASA